MTAVALWAFVLIHVAQTAESDAKGGIPQILRAAFLQREQFDTALMQCRITKSGPRNMEGPCNWDLRLARNGVFAAERGDDDGVMLTLNDTGQKILGYPGAAMPTMRLFEFDNNSVWARRTISRQFVNGSAGVWMGYSDFRSFGLRANEYQYATPKQQLENLASLTDWETKADKSGWTLVTVRGKPHPSGSHYEYRWTIDAKRGPSVISSYQRLVEANGELRFESEAICSLNQIDGVWWPETVDLRYSSGTRVLVEFREVQFNRPEHPRAVTPELLGIVVGAEVVRPGEKGPFFYVGNGRVVDEGTWQTEKSKYDLQPLAEFYALTKTKGMGKYPEWWNERGDTLGLAGVAVMPDQWEIFVRRWILIRSIEGDKKGAGPVTNEQRTAAQGVLDECRKKAIPIRTRVDKELARIQANLKEAESALSKADKKGRPAIEKRVNELKVQTVEAEKAPEIERIFESLKKRLDGLLTTEQLAPYVPAKPVLPPMGTRPAGKRPGASVP